MRLIRGIVNPVVSMEYRLRMRSKRTPWVLSLYLLTLGLVIFTFIYMQMESQGYFNPYRSRDLFIMLSVIQFIMVSLVTPGLTAGVISGERERQTLNILLTTGLSSTKIIIGKLLSSLSFMVFLLISSMPLYTIVFLYGGISPGQLLEVFGLYFVSMLAIGSVGVLFSSMFKRTTVSIILTYVTIIAYTVITLVVPEIIRSMARNYNPGVPNQPYQPYQPPTTVDWFYSINPITTLINIFDININNVPIDPFWIFSIFFLGVTLIATLLAIYLIKPIKRSIISIIKEL